VLAAIDDALRLRASSIIKPGTAVIVPPTTALLQSLRFGTR
jgi:hypothetical protein